MSKAKGSAGANERGAESEVELRAKYLDFCSAQVADILLLLSPDEMYTLAQDAAGESPAHGELTYDRIVSLATARISRKLALPPYEVWIEDYQASPEKYEHYLLGLWQSDVENTVDG